MSLPLTRDLLARGYDYLAASPPFSRWKLPPAAEIRFRVIKRPDRYAHYYMAAGRHHIEVSACFVGRHETLLATLAHEIIHLKQELMGVLDADPHGATFHRLADKVCKVHEFDRLTF